jgi:protein O-GlcNAc transferase
MNRKQRRRAAKVGQKPNRPVVKQTKVVLVDGAELLASGREHHQAGRLAEAEACYRRVPAGQPGHADALHLLGIIAQQRGRHDLAIEWINQAIKHNEHSAAYLCSLGISLNQLGKFDEAIIAYRQAIRIKPDFANAYSNLAGVLRDQGKIDEAIAAYRHAIKIKPDLAEAYANLGNTLSDQRDLEGAAAAYRRAIHLKPGLAEAHFWLANALRAQSELDEALASYDRALNLRPDNAEVLNARGATLQELKRFDEALASYDRALAFRSDYVEALNNRGVALQELKRFEEALTSYDRALTLRPDHADTLNNRGITLQRLKRYDEALVSYDRALTLRPDHADTLNNRGNTLQELKRYDEALASYERALDVKPDHLHAFSGAADRAMKLCDRDRWQRFARQIKLHVSGKKSIIHPFVLLGYSDDPALQLQCARHFVENMISAVPPLVRSEQRWCHDKLRIAYVSSDFRSHAIAHLMAGLFEQHDRSRFEIFGISFGDDDHTEIRRRLVAGFDHFHDVRSRSDEDVAKLLCDLQIDIAIDCNGHTRDARSGIFAHRPAPIQVSYLGFPAATGANFIDYIIADPVIVPREHRKFFSEKVVYLPDCYQVNDSKRKIAERTPSRREMGLPEHGFVFCCFNNNWKITPEMFDVWMRLLRQVDGGVLWLLRDNEGAERNLCEQARQRGVDPSRLVFAGRLSPAEHLARHRLADLFLDTLPYNAHTTASDALWTGLPVVTCMGQAFAGRVAGSLLHAVGLPELITSDLLEYEALALRLAREPDRLAEIKASLAAHRDTCSLFDTSRFARHLEVAYTTMWETWQRGETPTSFSVPLLA